MVDELFDGDMGRQLGKAADVVVVIVSDYQMIDLLNAGVPCAFCAPSLLRNLSGRTLPMSFRAAT